MTVSKTDQASIYEHRKVAHDFLKQCGRRGATLDELAQHMAKVYNSNITNNAAAQRLTELKKRGLAVKTGMKRQTRSRVLAEVVVLREFSNGEFDVSTDRESHVCQ